MDMSGVEWAALTPSRTVVATAGGGWIHAQGISSPFARPMTGPGSLLTTRNLLDAAAKAGWSTSPRAPEPPLTPLRWTHRLCGFFQTTHATPPLMREAARRFAQAGRATLAQWADTKAREEEGHDTLVLRDLVALGYDAEALVATLVPPVPAALVASFERLVHASDPVGCVGYAYALERLALEVDTGYIARVEASLPHGVRATRCLRVHSAAGSDRRHVDETVELVASLSPAERASVALACYETAVLCYALPEGEPLAEDVLERRLSPLELKWRKTS